MKKALVGVFVAVAVVCLVSAAGAVDQKNTGCGLGSMAFEGQNGLVSQTFAATTNGTFGNQTFGITSGTSNCEQYQSFTMNKQLNTFVADNMDSLAKDIAKGEGEYLDTMASLMELDRAQRPQFYALLQKNFSRIYSSPAVTPADVLAGISSVASSM
jgi:hypothetical protein